MSAPRTVAFIGLGNVVRNIHMPGLKSLGDRVHVIAGCDPDPEAREYAQKTWGLKVFESPGQMLESTKADIASICTPPWLHREQTLLALKHGLHVFCEKPVAEDLADTD